MSSRTTRTAVCAAAVLAAAAGSASAQAASQPVFAPRATAVTVPHSGVLTVPLSCSATPVLRTSGAQVAGRCESGMAARFTLPAATLRALRTPHTATVRSGASGSRLRLTTAVRAEAASVSGTWRDATLDCFPPGGGIMGGGGDNNSVALSVNWRSDDGATHYARHAVFYEEYWNNSGPYLRTPDGNLANTTPWYGAFQFGPNGILGSDYPTYGFAGGVTGIVPWTSQMAYPKSVHIQVRTQVALSLWNGAAWGPTTWRYAGTTHAPLGYATGICALG
jgi:hypothetical protein